ncbi:MAG: class I SAM-dependent methyltransferase [Planctomycetota bacterium]|nr:class I SAM-dependent methyltransferase [Planctomycetota bacterium]
MSETTSLSARERETWNRCAENYLDTFAYLTGESVPLLIEASGLNGAGIQAANKNVLEIGAGPGHVSQRFAEMGAIVTGIDFSAQMVAVAQDRYPDLTFVEADAGNLPFDDETFDVVIANYVVHHLEHPEKVFKEVSRVLKPNGRFVFAQWGPVEEQTSTSAFVMALETHDEIRPALMGPLHGVTERDVFAPMLSEAGLMELILNKHEINWTCETFDHVMQGFAAWANIASMPQDLQGRIEASTKENLKSFEQNGQYVLPHSVMLGMAVKRGEK